MDLNLNSVDVLFLEMLVGFLFSYGALFWVATVSAKMDQAEVRWRTEMERAANRMATFT